MSELAKSLSEVVDWKSFFEMRHSVGNQLNDRTLRFLKSIIQDKAIEKMSGGKVQYVDLIGQDHQFGEYRIETKCGTNVLTTGTGAEKKKSVTGSVKLNNTLGSSHGRTLPDTFDYLMIVDNDAVAIVKHENVTPHITSGGDGLSVKLPYSVLEWVVSPGEFSHDNFTDIPSVDVLVQLDEVVDKIITMAIDK